MQGDIGAVLARTRQTGGVILGRGAMVVLRSVPWALHVHLRGPAAAQRSQAARVLGIDEQTAARLQKRADRARMDHVSRVYGVNGNDPSLYHLVRDSTALSLDACVEIIVTAATARVGDLTAAEGDDA